MALFALLVSIFLLLHLPSISRLSFLRSRKDKARLALAVGFLFAGALHFITPERYLKMIPPFLPWPQALNYLAGFFEILGAVGLLMPRFQRAAAYGLVALLLAVFPANIFVAVNNLQVEGLPGAAWYYWVRLPFQFVFIAWALWCTKPEGVASLRSPQ
jgi:uncharacterized membrane protein